MNNISTLKEERCPVPKIVPKIPVGEKIWHESQKTTKHTNGCLEMTFRVAGLDEIKSWVLSLGPECQVLEPEKLRKVVQQDLQKNLAQYSTTPVSKEILREMRVVSSS